MRFSHASLAASFVLLGLFAPAGAQEPAPAQTLAPIAMCAASQISLGTDAENGAFDATSRSGTLLVLRNVSATACRVEAIANISFFDASDAPVAITIERESPFLGPPVHGSRLALGHGPVVLPLALAAGAEATTTLVWVSGEVYDRSACVTTAFVAVNVAGQPARTPLEAHVCAPDATQLHVGAKALQLDPRVS